MKVLPCPLEGLKLIELTAYSDYRGHFIERFHEERFKSHGLHINFPQENHSRSLPGVIRGLHFQFDPPQGKLVGVISGAIYDVVVDIRPSSPTYGQWYGAELSDKNHQMLWIPAGFAHGFAVLGNTPAEVVYKVSALYSAKGELGIRWNDSELAIDWPFDRISGKPIISERDQNQPDFKHYKQSPKF